ncbi:group-specific protein [Caldibacillus debilis]|uniref:group-specific protein n=1 Tax=Caldibacillus debilis TaxID=301148 RepID=UPI000B580192|nr:group-specific protein [Caldibacillus debilis]OUM83609.1 MAG: group-specific protein [Caldibacillus debilis]
MIRVQVNDQEVREEVRRQVAEKLKEADTELVFWDAKELMRRTCMSWNFIQQQFFFDPRFPKFKIGNKWYFPARETREFLLRWLKEQKRS